MPDITDQFASECLDVFYGVTNGPVRRMRAVLEFAFGHRAAVMALCGQTSAAAVEAPAVESPPTRLGEGLTEAQIAMIAHKTRDGHLRRTMQTVPSAFDPFINVDWMRQVHDTIEALRASAAPRSDHTQLQRMQERYDDLRAEGRHGHYECMFRVWSEEFELGRQPLSNPASDCANRDGKAEPEHDPVDWVKIAEATRAAGSHLVGYDKDAIIDGLVARVEALQARGV